MKALLQRLSLGGSTALLVAVANPSHGAAQTAVFESPGLRDYVSQVLARNAGLHAAVAHVDAAERRIAPAGALPDLTITVGAVSVPVTSFDLDREPMTQLPVMVQQRFPFPGKQRAATAVARADSAVADRSRGTTEADLVAAAVRAYFRLANASTALTVWRARVALADQAIAVARVRYETGAAPQTDLLRARLRRAELDEEQRRLDAEMAAAHARVDALRGGSGDAVTLPALISTAAVPGIRDDTLPSGAANLEELAIRNPALRHAEAEVERAESAAQVFGIAGRPEFTVGVQGGVRFGGREPFLTALIGISVPLYAGRKQGPAAHAARLDAEAAGRRYDDLAARVTGEVQAATAHLAALHHRILQITDVIVPLAEAASTSALQRYRVGAIEFSAVLDAQDDLFRAQLRLARLMADYGAAWGDLAALMGEEWYQ